MAFEERLRSDTVKAGADLSSEANAQYRIVKLSSSGVVLASAATDKLYGVLQNKPTSARAATVGVEGTTKIKAGGTIAIGDSLTSDANGAAIATTTSGNAVIAIARQAGASGDLIAARLVSPAVTI